MLENNRLFCLFFCGLSINDGCHFFLLLLLLLLLLPFQRQQLFKGVLMGDAAGTRSVHHGSNRCNTKRTTRRRGVAADDAAECFCAPAYCAYFQQRNFFIPQPVYTPPPWVHVNALGSAKSVRCLPARQFRDQDIQSK
jgi:hypothetical protein